MLDFCQVCRHYDIVGNKCSKAPKRAIPKSRCADYEGNTYRDLCKYCSHNNYGICTFSGQKCSVEPLLVNICRNFENKKVMDKKMEYEKKEWLCARCANQCKADGEMDYCEEFIDEEEAARIANAKKIAAIRKRCEEFMCGMVTDFPEIMLSDWVVIKEEAEKVFDFNRRKQSAAVYKEPFIKFTLTFKVYKKD